MKDGLPALSEREKETLRLLLAGHDAKSAARSLGLSVHTVNERLRDARRKLGAASSREAARRLAEAETNIPDFLVDKQLGVAGPTPSAADGGSSDRPSTRGLPLVWLSGGMLLMSLVIAAAMLASTFHANSVSQSPPTFLPAATTASTDTSPGAVAARDWATLVDRQRWAASWDAAGTLFKSQTPKDRWASIIQPVRQPLGPPVARLVQSATRTSSLPGAPSGDYEIVEFRTSFARKPDAVETVVLAREGSDWKVIGYFIR